VVKHAEQELLAAWKEAHPNNDEHNEIVESVTKEAARRSFLFPHEVHRGKELARLVDAVAESDSGARTKALEQLAGFVLAWRIAEVPHV
jgi:hypothetical protein